MSTSYTGHSKYYEIPAVATELIPPAAVLPSPVRDLLASSDHDKPLSVSDLPADQLSLFPQLQLAPPSPLPPLEIPVETPKGRYPDHLGVPASGLVRGAINAVRNGAEGLYGSYPLALHLANRKIPLEYTYHPLLAYVNEDGSHFHRLEDLPRLEEYREIPLVVAYLVAMAQRWLTAVPDREVRVWAVATAVEPEVQIYWADIKREQLANLKIVVNRSERWTGLNKAQERREMVIRCLAGLWYELRTKGTAQEHRKRWPLVPLNSDETDTTKKLESSDRVRELSAEDSQPQDEPGEAAPRQSEKVPTPTKTGRRKPAQTQKRNGKSTTSTPSKPKAKSRRIPEPPAGPLRRSKRIAAQRQPETTATKTAAVSKEPAKSKTKNSAKSRGAEGQQAAGKKRKAEEDEPTKAPPKRSRKAVASKKKDTGKKSVAAPGKKKNGASAKAPASKRTRKQK